MESPKTKWMIWGDPYFGNPQYISRLEVLCFRLASCWCLIGHTRCAGNGLRNPSAAGRILPLHSALLLRGEPTVYNTFRKAFDRSALLLQDAMVSVPTKPFEDLYSRAEAIT